MMAQYTCPSPGNVNPLRLQAYQFIIQKLPELTYFVQTTEIPEMQLGVQTQASSVHDIKIPGETMDYASLTIEFQVDEELKNWNSIYFWMVGLGYPEGHQLYRQYMNAKVNQNSPNELMKGYSDGSLVILDSANHPKQIFTFVDMFPISLSGLRFDSSVTDAPIAMASATFEYSYYYINKDIEQVV